MRGITRGTLLNTAIAGGLLAFMLLAFPSLVGTRSAAAQSVDGSKSAALFLKEDDGLAPATFDRLPLEWHKGRVKLLQDYLQEQGYAGSLLSDR